MPYPAYAIDFEPTGTIVDDIPWQPADQMTEQQSRFKFTVTSVEAKQVRSIEYNTESDLFSYGGIVQNEDDLEFARDAFVDWHDSQYPDNPYASNPNGFLIDIESI